MTTDSDRSAGRLALLDAAVYADVFDSAVGMDELHRYARTAIDRASFERALSDDPVVRETLVPRADAFALWDRPHLADDYSERCARATSLARRALRVARVLRHVPFVRGLALTGSVAAGGARRDADVDLLVVVAPGRLATTFLMLGPASRVIGRSVFCPNYYLSEDRLSVEKRSVYVARELAQARVLVGGVRQLRGANLWLETEFPNLPAPDGPAPLRQGSRLQRLLEAPLRGRCGRGIESLGRAVAMRRLRVHHGGAVPERIVDELTSGHSLRFHASGIDGDVPRRYASRRAEVATRLQQLDHRLVRSPAGRSS